MNLQKFQYNETISINYLIDVYWAVSNIGSRYYKWEVYHELHPRQVRRMETLERVFAYEFYHQLRIISERTPNYIGLQIDSEINKFYSGFKSPDIVIHGGQNDNEKQKVIIEIKTDNYLTTNDAGQNDIHKLIDYLMISKFEYGVFICANISMEMLIKLIVDEYTNNLVFLDVVSHFISNLEMVIIMTCGVDQKIEIERLWDILY